MSTTGSAARSDEVGSAREEHGKLRRAIADARRNMLDPTRRNRLLHAPLTGKRPWCLAIVDADINQIFDVLTGRARGRLTFAAKPSPNESDEAIGQQDCLTPAATSISASEHSIPHTATATEDGAKDVPRRGTNQIRLQTRLLQDQLDRRLTKIFRDARSLEEEQGLSTLFLAVGFLHWYESDDSQEPSTAPLILLPVYLDRVRGAGGYVLVDRDDDLVVNVSLQQKLRDEFGVELPDLPEGEEWSATEYLQRVVAAISRKHRWEVDSRAVGLGFFTFSKFLMWKDLDPESWSNGKLLAHELLNGLVGEVSLDEAVPALVADDESIDERIDLTQAVHVVDADSSQTVVIEEARRGRCLVVQGPPGTGKSQTITNIIASAVHAGRTVLFVAEKATALEVVHKRLKQAGLEALCLEMHSRKARRREILRSLEGAIKSSAPATPMGRVSARLAAMRDSLNSASAIVHKSIGRSERTPFLVMGTQLKHVGTDVPLLERSLEHCAEWDAEQIAKAEDLIERAAECVAKLQDVPAHHPWHGTGMALQSPFDLTRLRNALDSATTKISDDLSRLLPEVVNLCERPEPSLSDFRAAAMALGHLAAVPLGGRKALLSRAWAEETEQLRRLAKLGLKVQETHGEINAAFHEIAWEFDIGPLIHALRANGASPLRVLSPRYRQSIRDLRALLKQELPRSNADRIARVEQLLKGKELRGQLSGLHQFASEALGTLWRGSATDWLQVVALLQWCELAFATVPGVKLLSKAANDPYPAQSLRVAEQIDAVVKEALSAINEVQTKAGADFGALLVGGKLVDVPLNRLNSRLETWVANIDMVNDWVAVRDALSELRRIGLEELADGLESGTIAPANASAMLELGLAEALWKRASTENADLQLLDGAARTRDVSEFRELDRQRIKLARHEVLTKYVAGKPNGVAGDMGIIRAEIDKKRGHRSIRRLVENAGAAVQKLKPVFMMSPLSVAQFLPPGKIAFDLLVIDEASQVAPEDALGAIARARQVVIVGDHKQLPPTNFFKKVNAGSDDVEDDDAEEETTVGRPTDFESILTLARTRGIGERMLSWHYRSKHPSLIALSNEECYEGRLLLPPSPLLRDAGSGLSLVLTEPGHYGRGSTRCDTVQARAVADAIAQHMRSHPDLSLGVVCLSIHQRDAVDDMIDQAEIRAACDAFSPKVDERLFVKSLEEVQGDERDVMFISIAYGKDGDGRMTQSFGPISREGGDRRLNVLISRARRKCVVFSSLRSADIPAESAMHGTRMLRAFLDYAETGKLAPGESPADADFESPFEEAVARVVKDAGYTCHSQVGVSGFRIDLGVINPARPGRYILGVECDGASYHSARSARDRDRLRQEVLEDLDWKLHRIWSTDWFRSRQREVDRLLGAIRAADTANAPGMRASSIVPTENADIDDLSSFGDPGAQSAPAQIEGLSTSGAGHPKCKEYAECRPAVPHGRALNTLLSADIMRLVLEIVRAEGPIHTDEVARRLRTAFGLARTGDRIRDRVRRGLIGGAREGIIEKRGEFWCTPGAQIEYVRDRRRASWQLRRTDMIAPEEYRQAVQIALDDSVSLPSGELVAQTARLLGFERTGHDVKAAIEKAIGDLIREGVIIETEGKLRRADLRSSD